VSQRAIRWLTLLLVLSVLLPVFGVLAWTYLDARGDVQRDMVRVSNAARDRLDNVFDYGTNQLQVLGNLTDTLAQGCDKNVQNELRDIVFRSPYFREAGVLLDGKLVCTQYERYEPPVDASNRIKDALDVDGILVAAQRLTPNGPHNLILARHYGNRATGYLIVHPDAMIDFLPFFEPNARHGVYFLYKDRVAISSVGVIEEDVVEHLTANTQSTGVSRGDSIYAVARSTRTPVMVAAVSNTHLALHRWQQRLPWILLAAALLAALTFFLTRRLATAALSMQAELARAISSNRLSVEYQPFLDVDRGIVVGVEALVRWNNRRGGPLSPAVFVPLAEQMGLLPALTDFVFNRTLTELTPLLRRFPRMRVSINCHVSTLNSPALSRYVQQWRDAGLQPDRLVFEVTERANAHFDAESVKAPMQALKAQGPVFAMDDFGVGFSNLNSLRSLPFDFLKIDKAFVDGIGPDATDAAGFVDHIIALAKRLNLRVVAEGVETMEQRDYLHRAGVRFMQGWLFARAMPASALSAYIEGYGRRNKQATEPAAPQLA
jgi:sensor c-di-GMP phosphodiesterase-like protein